MKKSLLLQVLPFLITSSLHAAPITPVFLRATSGQDAKTTVEKAFAIDSPDICSNDAPFEHLKIVPDLYFKEAVLRFDLHGQVNSENEVVDKDCHKNTSEGDSERARNEIKQKNGDLNLLNYGDTGHLVEILMIPETTQLSEYFSHFHIWQLKSREEYADRPATYPGNDEMYDNTKNPVLHLSLKRKIEVSKNRYETNTDGTLKIDVKTQQPILKKITIDELQLNYQDADGVSKTLGFAPLDSIRGKWLKVTANFKIANDGFVDFKVETLDKNKKVQEVVFNVQHSNIDLWNENGTWKELYNKTGLYFGRTKNKDTGHFESVPDQTLFLDYLKVWKN